MCAKMTPFPRKANALFCLLLSFMVGNFGLLSPVSANSRIKDLATIEGVRENQLIGYGLVVGLNGTGDALNNSPFTLQSLQGMLERMGVNTRNTNLRTKNVAAVIVTGNLPPFATQGGRMDVTISALGDSTSLQGGTLLVTPLVGANGEVFAVAQGSLSVGGFTAQGNGASVTRGVPTVGRIANGALIEREIKHQFHNLRTVRLALRNPDLTTANRIANVINSFIGIDIAKPVNPATVRITLDSRIKKNMMGLLTDIEQLRVKPDIPAKVVIDEQSGIIVIGSQVRVSTVAIAQGNLTVTITETPEVSQAAPFAPGGATIELPRTTVVVDDESDNKLAVVKSGVSLQDLVDGLNALGIGPRDMISILQSIKAAGALQAEIELM